MGGATLITTGGLIHGWSNEDGTEPRRVPLLGCGERHALEAGQVCCPRRYTVVDERRLVAAAGYTSDRIVLPGELFTVRVASPIPS